MTGHPEQDARLLQELWISKLKALGFSPFKVQRLSNSLSIADPFIIREETGALPFTGAGFTEKLARAGAAGYATVKYERRPGARDFSVEIAVKKRRILSHRTVSETLLKDAAKKIANAMGAPPSIVLQTERGFLLSWLTDRSVPVGIFKERVEELRAGVSGSVRILLATTIDRPRTIKTGHPFRDPNSLEPVKCPTNPEIYKIDALVPQFVGERRVRRMLGANDREFARKLAEYLYGCSLGFRLDTLCLFAENLVSIARYHAWMRQNPSSKRAILWNKAYPGHVNLLKSRLFPLPNSLIRKWLQGRYRPVLVKLIEMKILVQRSEPVFRGDGRCGRCAYFEFNDRITFTDPPCVALIAQLKLHMKTLKLDEATTAAALHIRKRRLREILDSKGGRINRKMHEAIEKLAKYQPPCTPVARQWTAFRLIRTEYNAILVPPGQVTRTAKMQHLPVQVWQAQHDPFFPEERELKEAEWNGPEDDGFDLIIAESVADSMQDRFNVLDLRNPYVFLRYWAERLKVSDGSLRELESLVPIVSLDTIFDRLLDCATQEASGKHTIKIYDLIRSLSTSNDAGELVAQYETASKVFGRDVTAECVLSFLSRSSRLWAGEKTGFASSAYAELAEKHVRSIRIPDPVCASLIHVLRRDFSPEERIIFLLRDLANARRHYGIYASAKFDTDPGGFNESGQGDALPFGHRWLGAGHRISESVCS